MSTPDSSTRALEVRVWRGSADGGAHQAARQREEGDVRAAKDRVITQGTREARRGDEGPAR